MTRLECQFEGVSLAGTAYPALPKTMPVVSNKGSRLISCSVAPVFRSPSPSESVASFPSRVRPRSGRHYLRDYRHAGIGLPPLHPDSGQMSYGNNLPCSLTTKGLAGSKVFEPAFERPHQLFSSRHPRSAGPRLDLCGSNAGVHGFSGKPVSTCEAGVVPCGPELVSAACSRGGVRGALQCGRMGVRRRQVSQEKEVMPNER